MSSKMVIVPNPIITEYIDPLNKLIPEEEILEVNLDDTYNMQVSNATMPPVYLPSNENRDFLLYYVDASSDCIPNDSTKKMYYNSLGNDEKRYIPLDYLLFTRSDETQFLLAENISDKNNFKGLKSFSVLRYSPYSGKYNDSTIFSDGIDIARIREGDQEYTDAIADGLLSEKRINESLLSVDAISRYSGTDEIDHGGGYVGYVNANTNAIESSLEDSTQLRLLEQNVKGSQMILRDATPIDHVTNAIRTLIFRVKKYLQSKNPTWGGVIENGTTIPENKLNNLLREAPIKRAVRSSELVKENEIDTKDKDENSISIPLEEHDDKGANQEEQIDNENKAKETIASLRGISNAIEATHGRIKRDEPKGNKSKADKDKDEINNM